MSRGNADEQWLWQRPRLQPGQQRLDPLGQRARRQHRLEYDRLHLRPLGDRARNLQAFRHGLIGSPAPVVHEAGGAQAMLGEQVHHHHAEACAGGHERDIALGLDQLETQVPGGALDRRHGALGQHAAYREVLGIVPEVRAVVANELGVAGNEQSRSG